MYRSVKYIWWCVIIWGVLATGCDADTGLNCTQTAGALIAEELDVAPFDKITVYERVGLIIKQGSEQKVVVRTGANLLNDIDLKVEEGRLSIVNNNGCNLVRDYGISIIEITAPRLTEIRSSTGEPILSDGLLSYDSLTLLSTDGPEEDFYHSNGNFRLDLALGQLYIQSDNLSNFYLTGTVHTAHFEWLAGDGRLLAPGLQIQRADIFHRGTNTWELDVEQKIAGTISGYGDVKLSSRPDTVAVAQTWRGRLIIQD